MTETEHSNLSWIKASQSIGNSACVELADAGEMIALRDSKNPGTTLFYTPREIAAFLAGAKGGEFDHLIAGRA